MDDLYFVALALFWESKLRRTEEGSINFKSTQVRTIFVFVFIFKFVFVFEMNREGSINLASTQMSDGESTH